MEVSRGNSGVKYIEHGFSAPEPEGTWIEGDFGGLQFYCAEQCWAAAEDYDLVVYMRGRAERDTSRPQHCTVVINGVAIAYVEVPEQNARYAFRVPRNAFNSDGRMRIQLIPDHSEMVYNPTGQVIDGRTLSIHIQRFGVISRVARPRPALAPELTYDFGADSPALAALREGMAYPDRDGVLLLGKAAHLVFTVKDFQAPMHLQLWLTDSSGGEADTVPFVAVSINGGRPAAYGMDGPDGRIDIPLTADGVGENGICAVTLEFGQAGPDPENPGKVLAARLRRLRIADARPPAPQPPSLAIRIRGRLKRMAKAALGRP
jgi:hypothetical protein